MAFNFFTPNTQIKSSELNANFAAIADGSEVANEAWATWTPTLSGRFNDSKWTKACKYIQIGKTVHGKFVVTANAATPMDGGSADIFFTLPVTATSPTLTNLEIIGRVNMYDQNVTIVPANITISTTSLAVIRGEIVSGTYNNFFSITSTTPFTWASTYVIGGSFTYEAA